MSIASQARSIDDLTEKAVGALAAKRYFEAENLAAGALNAARDDDDFRRMAAVLPTLQQARTGRLALAMDVGTITILDEPFDEDVTIEPGCYLVQPPLVGADARRLRHTALTREIPVMVLCREPVIRLGLVPFVALGSGATVRTKMRKPKDLEHPDLEWLVAALEALGEAAAEMDPAMSLHKRINALMTRIDAIPEHAGLHELLEESCRKAAEVAEAS